MVCTDHFFTHEQSRQDTPILSAKVANQRSGFTLVLLFYGISDKDNRALDVWFLRWILSFNG